MRMVMGELNRVRLLDLMNEASGVCSRVTAAVAYATQFRPFFEHCINNKIFLEFFGLLDQDGAVSVAVLDQLLRAGPLAVSPRLIKGHFHSKVIWWHGVGAYIGSANLTSPAWFANVECGVFFEEYEIIGKQLQGDLDRQFNYLRFNSSPVTAELLKALSTLESSKEAAFRAKKQLESKFVLATKDIPNHLGLVACGPGTRTPASVQFTTEWSETLQLLRGLCREFHELNKRPGWVAPDAEPTVHFDQFLHAFYYVRVPQEYEGNENVKSVERVNQAFLENRKNVRQALEDAADWWASLPNAPYGEDSFIRDTAPMVRRQFAKDVLSSWKLSDFQSVFYEVHAFKTHARQVKNKVYGLPESHSETTQDRSNRLAAWLWEKRTEQTQRTVLELLQFLVWGTSPSNMVERLWLVTTDPEWRFDHLGPSSLGEAIGWARPGDFPPRNNRTNKALRALGHDVRLFSE